MDFLSTSKDGAVILTLYVQPKASRACICGVHDGALKLAVTAPPADGKANKAVIRFLATFFKLPKQKIDLIKGLQSRKKQCVIRGISMEEVRQSFEGLV